MSCRERRDAILLLHEGLLDEAEARELRAHLETGCAECAGYVSEARGLFTDLALAPEPETPHPALKDRLERRLRARTAAAAPPRRTLPLSWVAPASLAAGLAAVASLVTFRLAAGPDPALLEELAALREERTELGQELEEADAELGELEAELDALRTELGDARDQVTMLRKPELDVMSLAGTEAQPDARARMFWEWSDGYYCYLHVTGLAPVAEGAVYALWLQTASGERLLVGSFTPASDGTAVLWAKLPSETGRAEGAAVTLESEDPGTAPAGPVQLRSL